MAIAPTQLARDGTLRGKRLGPAVGMRPPYHPNGAARELMRNHDREVLLSGPSGTGKSMACLQKIDLAASQTPIRAAIVRKLRTALTQAAMVTYKEKVLPPPPNAIWFHHEDQEFRYPNGSRVVVAGLDDPRKVLSTDFDLIYCFVGDTRVSSPSPVVRAFERVYHGPLVTIRTAAGHELTGTPNHPILTDQGWVALGLLHEGSYVVSRTGIGQIAEGEPDIDHEPATIAQVARALMLTPAAATEWIKGVRMDFHGDGAESQIHVVTAGGSLHTRFETALDEPVPQHERGRRNLQAQQLVSGRASHQPLFRYDAPTIERTAALAEPAHPLAVGIGMHPALETSTRSSAEPLRPFRITGKSQRLAFTGRTPAQTARGHLTFEPRSTNTNRLGALSQATLTGKIALDRVVDVRRSRATGSRYVYNLQTVDGYYYANNIITHNCQEATELDEQDWLILLTRLRNNALSYQQILADCNPSYPNHWLKQRADNGQITLLESRHEDNPQLFDHATAEYTRFGVEYLKTLDSLTGYLHKRLRLGLWVAAEGMFYPEWDPAEHVVDVEEEFPADWPRWISVDYGFAVPFCALWFCRDPETREIWVYREAYTTGLRDEQQADLIKARTGSEKILQIVLDPSMFNSRTEQRRPSIAQIYADRGLARMTEQGIFPGQNNRKQGWAIVRRALAHDEHPPRLQIVHGACPNLVRELPALVRDPLDPEDTQQTVRSKEVSDHAMDALRYGLCTEALPAPASAIQATFG